VFECGSAAWCDRVYRGGLVLLVIINQASREINPEQKAGKQQHEDICSVAA
jgi:hypothetical protein